MTKQTIMELAMDKVLPTADNPRRVDPVKEELQCKRRAETIKRFRDEWKKIEMGKLGTPTAEDWEVAVMLSAAFLAIRTSFPGWESMFKNFTELRKCKKGKSARIPEAARQLWNEVRTTIANNFDYYGPVTQCVPRYYKRAQQAAELVGFDLNGLLKTVSKEKGFTEPKAWSEE